MDKYEFLEIYKKLTYESKEQIDQKLEDIETLQESISDLTESINQLSPQELADIQKQEAEFIAESKVERQEILDAEFTADDSDEAEDSCRMAIVDHEDQVREILTTQYPSGIEILKQEIENLEDEILKLIPMP